MNRARRRLQVLKFGGTSVGNADRIRRVALRAAAAARGRRTIIVVSAMAGTTDLLVRTARAAASDGNRPWREAAALIRNRHLEAARVLLPLAQQAQFARRLGECIHDFENICRGFSLVGEATARGLDHVAGLGEVISAELLAATLEAGGTRSRAIDAVDLILTDDRFGDAAVLAEPTAVRLRERLLPVVNRGVLPVVTGFRGATRTGVPTTLGRGSSDYTATLIGSLLNAEEITIWTDVDGVMTADPSLVPGARVIPRLSYGEAIELAFFGAKVVHWKAILPVMDRGIPVRVRNSFRPAVPGTRIERASASWCAVAAVTTMARVRLLTVRADRSIGPLEMMARVLALLEAGQTHPLLVIQSSAENTLSLALPPEDGRVLGRLEQHLSIRGMRHGLTLDSNQEVGLVAAIGEKLQQSPAIAAKLFGALSRKHINVFAVANGPSGQGVALAVRPAQLGAAVRALHQAFRLDRP
ncbi:MAG TPA: aspartate kinase [Candidatus Acidoferrales bacterium]|nr:aspartate kinase [Candidatus Acidoferrales bacterium]